jgi:antitoxin component HigA of HigAB toxin-antitoxin module
MSNRITEQQVGADLAKIDLINAIGSKSAKRIAMKHRAACFTEIKRMNQEDGLDNLADDELLAELFA